MKHRVLFIVIFVVSSLSFASDNKQLQQQIRLLQQQTTALQAQLNQLQKQLIQQKIKSPSKIASQKANTAAKPPKFKKIPEQNSTFHSSSLSIHALNDHPESLAFYPTALIADDHVVTYIAGTPVVTSPYLGDRPAFDGSDYIVNISSINRDIRLMQQRRRLYQAYQNIGYPIPNKPIIALSGKSEPVATLNQPYWGTSSGDLTLGSSELDVAAALNKYVEAFMGIAYDESPPAIGGQRLANSSFNLNLGFVNIGNLDESPFYFTAGQLFAPFGKYGSAMVSSPLTLILTRTKTRPFIFGYKSPEDSGPYAAAYAFKSDTTLGKSGVGGINLGYAFQSRDASGDIGVGFIGSIADARGMQYTGSQPGTSFGGFASATNGNESVKKVPGLNVHANVSFDRYSLTAEWVGAARTFRTQDLSFNDKGAKPQAAQLEGGVTFKAFHKPASLAVGYQWTKEALALNLPKHRASGVFNISLWKDTVESLEYRHDFDYKKNQFANGVSGINAVNNNTLGSGHGSDSLIAQIGVYF